MVDGASGANVLFHERTCVVQLTVAKMLQSNQDGGVEPKSGVTCTISRLKGFLGSKGHFFHLVGPKEGGREGHQSRGFECWGLGLAGAIKHLPVIRCGLIEPAEREINRAALLQK